MWKVIIFCAIYLWPVVLSERKAVSLVELAKCKQYQCYGYGYKTYFIVEDLHHLRNETDLLHMRLAILAGRDAHILLSDTNSPGFMDNVVEIVLGAGSNTFAEIRKRMGHSSIKSKRHPEILSYVDPMAFEVRVTKRGVIDVRYEGDTDPLITAEYGNANVTVQFIAFSCWGTSTCKFFFDCPNSLYDSLTETNVTASPRDTLENELMTDLSRTVPANLRTVAVALDICNVRFDQMNNVLKTTGRFWYQWEDKHYVWDPDNYDNITELQFHYNDVFFWVPILRFVNGVGLAFADTSDIPMRAKIYRNGTVASMSKSSEVWTWCSMDGARVWPHEVVKCTVNLTAANGLNVSLVRLEGHKATVKQSENNEWDIASVDMTLFDGAITYTITLKRNEAFIDSLFGSPLTFALVMLMASICVRESMYRLMLIMVSVIMLFATLLTLTKHVPSFYNPLIVQYYCTALGYTILAMICYVVALRMDKNPPGTAPPSWILALSNNRTLNNIFCFIPGAMEYDNFAETTKDPWMIISSIIDRLYFLSVLVFLVVIAIQGF